MLEDKAYVKATHKFVAYVNSQIKLIKDSEDKHQVAQKAAANMADYLAHHDDEGVYDDVLTNIDEESMGTFVQVMNAPSFIANGTSKKGKAFIKHSGDEYFADNSYDAATPYLLTSKKALDDLKNYKQTAIEYIR